jgi:excinuclease ABC subunit A
MEELAPRNFSFNNPHGACPACTGLGSKLEIDPDLVIPDKGRPLADGAIRTLGRSSYFYNDLVEAVANRYKISMDKPFGKLTVKERQIILYGNNGDPLRVKYVNSEGQRRWYETSYEGIIPNLERRHRETESEFIRAEIERLMTPRPCPVCKGKRLKPEYLAVTVSDRSIMDVCALSITAAQDWFTKLRDPYDMVLDVVHGMRTFSVAHGSHYSLIRLFSSFPPCVKTARLKARVFDPIYRQSII